MSLQESYIQVSEKVFPPLSQGSYPVVIERGEGPYLYDIEGKQYIDFATGVAIAPVGHCHSTVVKAVQDQASTLMASMNIIGSKIKIDCADRISQLMPGNLKSLFFANSGTEAIEGAMKLARKSQKGREHFIAFNRGFHGRSSGAMSISASNANYRKDYSLIPNCHFVDFPCHCISTDETFSQLDKMFRMNVSPNSVAAIIVEPIIGEGGYVFPPMDFLPRLRKLCDEHGILLIFDEVQTGFGRTGKWFACEHYNVVPDILVFAKGVASGLPLGGFAARPELMKCMVPGTHGSTFGGNSISCAAALATIQVIEREDLLSTANVLGQKVIKQLSEKFGEYIEVRGKGLMIALEPKPGVDINIKSVLKRLFAKGLIGISCGQNVMRIIPPLNIPESVLYEGIAIIEQVLDYEILLVSECQKLQNANA